MNEKTSRSAMEEEAERYGQTMIDSSSGVSIKQLTAYG